MTKNLAVQGKRGERRGARVLMGNALSAADHLTKY